MTQPIYKTVTAPGNSDVVPLDHMRPNYQASIFIDMVAGAPSCTVQTTADDVQAPGYDPDAGYWQPHSSLVSVTASSKGHLDFPATAVRLSTTGTGTARMAVLEGGSIGGKR